MKSKIFVLLAVIFVLLSLTTFATETEELNGFYDIGTYQNVDINPYSGDTAVNATMQNLDADGDLEQLYEDSNRLEVSYKAATNDGYYGVILVEGTGLPTKDNMIFYIDQVSATGSTVNFNVYPILPKRATPLSLYISSNVENFELVKVPLNYYLPTPPYVLGDIDNNGLWNSSDALTALQIGAGLYDDATEGEKAAANVNGDDYINSTDALMILQYGAGLIDSWD